MKISASIYSAKDKSLDKIVRELDLHHVDCLHIDSIEDLSVFDDIKKIRSFSNTPIDLHVISEEPEKYFQHIIDNKIDYVTFQYESLKKPLELPAAFKNINTGIAITSDTSVEIFSEFENECEFILMMTTTPGKSGGTFNKENFRKIRKFKRLFGNKKVHVDGGVNHEVSFILRNMGADLIVSGSYLVNATSVGAAMMNLKINESESKYTIKDFMLEKEEVPLLSINDLNLLDVLKVIEKYRYGFVNIAGENNKLEGIITNADVRRAMIENINNLNKMPVESLLNRKPVFVNENRTITELLKIVKSHNFPIQYMPVVNDKKVITGAIVFNYLIKGES